MFLPHGVAWTWPVEDPEVMTEWLYDRDECWYALRDGPLANAQDPLAGLAALTYVHAGASAVGAWQLWSNDAASAPYPYAISLPVPVGGTAVVWLPDLPSLIAWMGRYGGLPLLVAPGP